MTENHRIIDRALKSAGVEPTPTLTSNSIIVLYTHVKTGRWASVMPAKLAETLGFSDAVRAIPIVDPLLSYNVGLLIPQREPLTPLVAATGARRPRGRAGLAVRIGSIRFFFAQISNKAGTPVPPI
jgi:DNA-binding transcriptional LysR family regulator